VKDGLKPRTFDLEAAARYGNQDIVELVLTSIHDSKSVNVALLAAVDEGYVSIAARLMREIGISRVDADTGKKLLFAALDLRSQQQLGSEHQLSKRNPRGVAPTVRLLIEHGADMATRNADGLTSLGFAIREACCEQFNVDEYFVGAFDALAKAGATLPDHFENGYTSLTLGAGCEKPGIVLWLLEHGQEPNATDAKGRTPLALACSRDRYTSGTYYDDACLKTTRILLEHGADPDIADDKGVSPYSIALKLNYKPLADLIIRYHEQKGQVH
jgi:ankyrin repeat protein